MKTIKHNDFTKYLVEDCKNVRIEKVVKRARGEIAKALMQGLVEIGGFDVRIISSSLHHGGLRLWFECPICSQKVGVIYQHPTKNNLIGCRGCLGLDYRSRSSNKINNLN